MEHSTISANGAQLHVAKPVAGREPLLLSARMAGVLALWEPLMQRLQDRFTLIAPDPPRDSAKRRVG